MLNRNKNNEWADKKMKFYATSETFLVRFDFTYSAK